MRIGVPVGKNSLGAVGMRDSLLVLRPLRRSSSLQVEGREGKGRTGRTKEEAAMSANGPAVTCSSEEAIDASQEGPAQLSTFFGLITAIPSPIDRQVGCSGIEQWKDRWWGREDKGRPIPPRDAVRSA